MATTLNRVAIQKGLCVKCGYGLLTAAHLRACGGLKDGPIGQTGALWP